MQARPTTMADVAARAGVSRATVSFVFNGRDVPITDATRERIFAAATELNYRPNAAAQALARQRSGWYGFVTEVVTSPFAVDIISGAQEQANNDGRFLMITPNDNELGASSQAVEKLLEQRVEGLIIAATWHRGISVPAAAHDVPCVLVNCFDVDGVLPSVVPDEVGGGRTAARVFIDAGHTEIAHITLTPGIPAQVERLRGFREELQAANLELQEEFLLHGDGTADSGYRLTQELLGLAHRPTAIFCGNDRMAMGAYDAIREAGLTVAQDVSIVGFDNQEILTEYLRPGLTTVALPFAEMGARGVSMLASRTTGSQVMDHTITIDCPLHIRSSVGLQPA